MSLKTNKEILKKERKNVRIDKLSESQIIPLKIDFMFTQIFNDENYDFVLYQLLSDVLSIKKEVFIGNIRYLNRDLKNSNKKNMLNKVDLLIKHKMFNEDGNEEEEYINVEINTSNSMLRRNKVYSNKIGSFSLDVGDNTYDNIDRLVQVNFDFFDTNKLRLVSISQMKDQDNIIDTGWDDIFYTISVNFALNPWYNLIDEREKKVANWCILMNTNDLETFKRKAEEIMGKDDAEKLIYRVEELSCDKENIALFTKLSNEEMAFNTRLAEAERDAKKRYKDGVEEGIEKGIEQGIEQGSKENAKNAINLGLDNETISKITGLSVEEIEKIRKC